jgi:hypothetical protein
MLGRLGNPLTSEAAAFRWLVAITAVVAVVMLVLILAT